MTTRMTSDRPGKGNPRPDTRPEGYTFLPGGPAFQSREKMAAWMAKNPGWVYKHRSWVKSQVPRAAALGGFIIDGDEMRQYKYDGGKGRVKDSALVRLWTNEASGKGVTQMNRGRDIKAEVFVRGQKMIVDKDGRLVPTKSATPTKTVTPSPGAAAHPDSRGGGRGAGAGDVAGATDTPALDLSQLFAGVTSPETQVLPTAWANSGARLFGGDVAEQLAGLQFDREIGETRLAGERMTRTNAQNEADVKNWFGQVLKSQGTAATRDAAINEAAVDSVRDAGAAILSGIGGAANEGASTVGAANAAAVGTLEALGANQEAFNADLRPLLEAEKAGALSREQAMGTARAQELSTRLAALEGERGQAKAGFQFQVDQANNAIRDTRAQRALEIRQANNSIAQQNFQNALALANAQLGAAVTGINIEKGLADLAAGPNGGKATSYPFAKAPVSQRNDAYNQALSSIMVDGTLTTSVPRAVQLVNQVLAGYGWSRKNPAVMALRNQILQDAGIRPDPRWR